MEAAAAVRKGIHALAITISIVGLWFWLAPFHGPPGTLESTRTALLKTRGERGLCPPALFGYTNGSLADNVVRATECQKVGMSRLDLGWMFFASAGALFVATRLLLGASQDGGVDAAQLGDATDAGRSAARRR